MGLLFAAMQHLPATLARSIERADVVYLTDRVDDEIFMDLTGVRRPVASDQVLNAIDTKHSGWSNCKYPPINGKPCLGISGLEVDEDEGRI